MEEEAAAVKSTTAFLHGLTVCIVDNPINAV